mmetsp:Transcript_13084/g.19255  ORF Transcript_13084/g.19255 Transcript_13084/m.19255 type:complete len:125 (-) Transcript_13084:114-488(-)
MNKRTRISPVNELINPIQAVGMEATIKMIPIRIRAPYLSHRDPKTKRMTMSKATAKMLDVHISSLSRSKSCLMIGRSGAMANQIKKAMKKPHHEKWKARMWGRLAEQSLSSVALSSCSGSTLTA